MNQGDFPSPERWRRRSLKAETVGDLLLWLSHAKQDITEAIKFLAWLHETHQRTAVTCLQQDADEWLASGPSTRQKIRNFFAWAKKSKLNRSVQIDRRQAIASHTLTQEQRLAWLKELLDGDSDALAYRAAGILLLRYAQPLTKIAALQTSAVTFTSSEMRISLGQEPISVPPPFDDILSQHMRNRPHLRAAGGLMPTPWLFPSTRPGWHLDPQMVMKRLRSLGIDLLGARNTALQSLVVEVPPPLVAELLGYSYNVTQRHAEIAAQPWARYATGER